MAYWFTNGLPWSILIYTRIDISGAHVYRIRRERERDREGLPTEMALQMFVMPANGFSAWTQEFIMLEFCSCELLSKHQANNPSSHLESSMKGLGAKSLTRGVVQLKNSGRWPGIKCTKYCTRIISDLQLPGWSLPGCSQLVQLVPLRFSQWTHVWLDYNWILDNHMNWTWRWNKSPLFSGSCDSVTPKWPLKSIESDCQLIRDTNIARGLSRAS